MILILLFATLSLANDCIEMAKRLEHLLHVMHNDPVLMAEAEQLLAKIAEDDRCWQVTAPSKSEIISSTEEESSIENEEESSIEIEGEEKLATVIDHGEGLFELQYSEDDSTSSDSDESQTFFDPGGGTPSNHYSINLASRNESQVRVLDASVFSSITYKLANELIGWLSPEQVSFLTPQTLSQFDALDVKQLTRISMLTPNQFSAIPALALSTLSYVQAAEMQEAVWRHGLLESQAMVIREQTLHESALSYLKSVQCKIIRADLQDIVCTLQ